MWIDAGCCPAEALTAAALSLGELAITCRNFEGNPEAFYEPNNSTVLRLQNGWLHLELATSKAVRLKTTENGARDAEIAMRIKWSIPDLAARWKHLDHVQRPSEFPLVPLVRAWWHSRPPTATLCTRETGRIFPAKLAMASPTDSRAGNLFSHAAHVGEDQMVFLGFQTERTAPALPLHLYDLGLGKAHAEKATGAPLPLRIFVESILAISQEDRRGDGPVTIAITLRDFLKRLYPGRRRPRPKEYWPRLISAAEALDSLEARVPWYDPDAGHGGLRRMVTVRDLPNGPGALDDLVGIMVDLPPGSQNGPQISDNLGWWGLKHRREYRALLNLAYWWHHPGQTVRPVGRRAGGQGHHWQRTTDPAHYPAISDSKLVEIVFPTSARSRTRNLLSEARKVFKNLEKAGELRILDKKVLPPLNLAPRRC